MKRMTKEMKRLWEFARDTFVRGFNRPPNDRPEDHIRGEDVQFMAGSVDYAPTQNIARFEVFVDDDYGERTLIVIERGPDKLLVVVDECVWPLYQVVKRSETDFEEKWYEETL